MFSLAEDAEVQIKVFNIIGQEVVVLHDDWTSRGVKTVEWDGRNSLGSRVASGVYIILLKTQNWSAIHKINLTK
jgi:flagellar hook assembly protein FlgD